MTLRYASPEQVRGEAVITTASDVYSLGVLLYQLLCGHLPYGADASDAELEAAICSREPVSPPSAMIRLSEPLRRGEEAWRLRWRLSGDLDAIVLKALQKEPTERYGSVAELAEDLRRHLRGRPVAARRRSLLYRSERFVYRNALALLVASVILTLGSGWLVARQQAVTERRQALTERQQTRAVIDFLEELFEQLSPNRTQGREPSARDVLDQARESQSLSGALEPHSELRAQLTRVLGRIYRRLGDAREARGLLEESLAIRRRLYSPSDPEVIAAFNDLAVVLYDLGEYEAGERLSGELVERVSSLELDENVATLYNTRATFLTYRGGYEEAESLYLQILELRRRQDDLKDVADSLLSLGVLYYTWGELETAAATLGEALAIRRDVYDEGNTRIATAANNLAMTLVARGRFDEAQELFDEALAIRRQRYGDGDLRVAHVELNLAAAWVATGRSAEAEPLLLRALDLYRGGKPGDWRIAQGESVLGECLTRLGRYDEAEPLLLGSFKALRAERGERAIYTRHAGQRVVELYEAWGEEEKTTKKGGP